MSPGAPFGGLGAASRTIRVRLTLWYVALLAIILLTFSGFLYVNLSGRLRSQQDQTLSTEARQLVTSLEVQDGRVSLSGDGENRGSGSVVTLYGPRGIQLIDSSAPRPLLRQSASLAQTTAAAPAIDTVRLADGSAWRVLTVPLIENGNTVGVLQIARSEAGISAALGQLKLLMGIAVPATLLLAIVGGLFLAGRALNPIDRMTRTVQHLGADDLSKRLGFHGVDDEIGRLAATFDQLLNRVDRAFQRQRQFTADASHELRTPLALIRSQLELSLERSRTPSEYRQVLASLYDDVQRMTQLLSDLLLLARADDGGEVAACEPLDLGELVRGVVTALEPLARTRGVRLEHNLAGPAMVAGDQTRLTQLLVNLVDNGLKYTRRGGSVVISVRRARTSAILEVADTGVGIDAEHLPHLFERFYRVDKARSRAAGGAGLGLAICQWIAETHGGSIAVTSRPGYGTTFTVTLPSLPGSAGSPKRPLFMRKPSE